MIDIITGAHPAVARPVAPHSAEQVYQEYAGRVYAVARRMTGSEADAEDVTQEVLVQVVRRLSRFRGDSTLMTWLYRVTVNAVFMARRKRATARARALGDTGAGERPSVSHRHPGTPAQEVIRSELRDRMETAISSLPESYRDAFLLADVEGRPNAEVGALLGLSLAAVKSRIHRARLMLREELQPYLADGSR